MTLEARKARELLQSLKRAGPAVSASAILPELEHIERGLSRWRRQHSYIAPSKCSPCVLGCRSYAQHGADGHATNEQSLLRSCIDLEYQYLVMYSFAPASHVLLNDSEPRDTGERSAHSLRPEALCALAARATSASREILNILVGTLEPSKMLKYVPVRFWQFIVAAILHLLKVSPLGSLERINRILLRIPLIARAYTMVQTTLSAEPATMESKDDLRLLRASILAVRNGSPDDTHMAVRYAQFLEIFLDSSYHSSRAETPARVRDGGSSTHGRGGFHPEAEEQGQSTSYVGGLGDFDLPDFVNGLGNIGDLVDWSDGPFGVFGALGFLQNG